MSLSVSARPLPYKPFILADVALLLVAVLIAWRTPDALTGGSLFAVVFCAGLGAVLAVLPFIINDAHQRDAALAERQRELSEMVTTSTAHAARWGTQWASAAIGLEDAAASAARSLAAAERLPLVFQEKADVLEKQLAALAATCAALEHRLTAAPAEIEARLERVQGTAEERIASTLATLSQRMAELEAAFTAIPVPAPVVPQVVPEVVPPVQVVVAPPVEPVIAVVPTAVQEPTRSKTIMDPFLIPDDGYAALAEAMDLKRF